VGLLAADDFVRLAAQELTALADVASEQSPAGSGAAPSSPVELRRAAHYEKSVSTVRPDATAREVARALGEAAVGCVVVESADGKPVGIVTDRDLAVRVVARDLDPDAARASEVMSGSLLCVDGGESLQRVVAAMSEWGVRRIPVTRDGRLTGIVTYDDVLATLGRELVALGGIVRSEARPASGRA